MVKAVAVAFISALLGCIRCGSTRVRGGELSEQDQSSRPQAGIEPHPFLESVRSTCSGDLSANGERNFYQMMTMLEERKDQVSSACKKAIFTATASSPNLNIVEVVHTSEREFVDWHHATLYVNASIGYVKAPLFPSTPEWSPVYKTWFLILHAKVQPAPAGILFVHNGGPSPGIWNGLDTLGEFSDMSYVHENFDIVQFDQRGLGLSAVGLLPDEKKFAFPKTLDEILQMDPKLLHSTGRLGDSWLDANGKRHRGPCRINSPTGRKGRSGKGKTKGKPRTSHPGLNGSKWKPLQDASDLEEVEAWLDGKAELTSICSAKFNRDDGEGGSYNLLQYMGTQALAHDIEWLRWALGAPSISVLGFSYGTRAAAAYASQFPARVRRVAVTGVVAPMPDLLDAAKNDALNTAEILGFIQAQCALNPKCMENPFKKNELSDPRFYFRGDFNEAMKELFARSTNKGQWYKDHCNAPGPSTEKVAKKLEELLTTGDQSGYLSEYDKKTWPMGFLALPARVFDMLQWPCDLARSFEETEETSGAFDGLSIFDLMPALDCTGRWGKPQVAKVITDYAKDVVFSPGLSMFMISVKAAYGWPQLPAPIGFANPTVDAVIVNPLYDERTGMINAQEFQRNFPRSSLVTSPVGGHCVDFEHGVEGWKVLENFVLYGSKPSSGDVVGNFVPLDFAKGTALYRKSFGLAPL